jgi:hypothetical protein
MPRSEGKDNQTLDDGLDVGDNRKEESVTDLDAGNVQQQDTLIFDNTVSQNALLDLNHSTSIDDSFNFGSQTDFKKNNRVTTRFIRDDIAVAINVPGRLGFGKTISVNLMDISCKGALISTGEKLGINKQITLDLQFKTGKKFVIKAKIVRHSSSPRNEYGIKFDSYNNELGDYLLETQDKLIFK